MEVFRIVALGGFMDPCYELIADRVTPEAWQTFTRKLKLGFRAFPEQWELSDALRERLILRLQWHFFNPDTVEPLERKTSIAWAFATSFLESGFTRKFTFLRSRLETEKRNLWDKEFADFETLLLLSSMPDDLQLDWLSRLDGKVRYGISKRVKVIKNKGLGLHSELLGVHPLMDWQEIRARFRFLLKRHHPDVGGDPEVTKQLIAEFTRLEQSRKTKSPNHR